MPIATSSDLVIPQDIGVLVYLVMVSGMLLFSAPILLLGRMRNLLRISRGWRVTIPLYCFLISAVTGIHTYAFALLIEATSSGNVSIAVSGFIIPLAAWFFVVAVIPRLGYDWDESGYSSKTYISVGACFIWYSIGASSLLYLGKSGILNRLLTGIFA